MIGYLKVMNLLCNSIQQVHTSTVNIIIVNVNTGLSEKIPNDLVDINVGVDKPVLMAESLPLENIKEPIHITIPLTSMKSECGNCVTVN